MVLIIFRRIVSVGGFEINVSISFFSFVLSIFSVVSVLMSFILRLRSRSLRLIA